MVIVWTPLAHASAYLDARHGSGHPSEHEDETRGPLSAHDASSTNSKRNDGERERRPGHSGGSDGRVGNRIVHSLCDVVPPSQYGFCWERKRCLLSGKRVGCTA